MFHHCHWSYGIGGATTAPSTKPTAPRHKARPRAIAAAEQEMPERRYGRCSEEHASDREQEDWAKIETEAAPAHTHT